MSKDAPARVGRPPWEPTAKDRENVKTLAGRGVPEKMIAAIVGVDKLTLRKHCAQELVEGRSFAVTNVLGAVYKQALSGDFHHARLYLANTIGWHLTNKIEHTGRIDTARLERGKERAIAAARGTLLTGDGEDSDPGEPEEDG